MNVFTAKIYQIGINWAVDVPSAVSEPMKPNKGYIRIKGKINNFDFTQTLVPVKNGPYRLFVNLNMMKGAHTAVGDVATFEIEQNHTVVEKMYPMPALLDEALEKHLLHEQFESLSPAKRKDILKYLSDVKTVETMRKNIDKVITQLRNNEKIVRIP